MTASTPPPAGKPGRYPRTFNGLIASMVVIVLGVLAFVGFRAVFRAEPTVDLQSVDYLSVVRLAQDSGFPVAYPPELPEEWTPTSSRFEGVDGTEWSVGIVVGEDDFVGVKVRTADVDDTLENVLREEYETGDPVTVDATDPALAGEWGTATQGVDTALTLRVPSLGGATGAEGITVVVYGSLDEDALADVAAGLTTEPLPAR
ncbi:DUF4245 family protein [Nocardioides alkalitolerans]|uniref:DUF4245 family protein n=1 Tax=Nocardioides alkalitolerans TaxID=281714 RepID=UPI0003F6FE60|nr:DUF4245 family protein [Nocardioides alkalitolerans]